jgi:hypothetical protein
MPNTFEMLAQFLDRFGDEVQGRQAEEPPESVQPRLRALASGRLPAMDRSEVFSLLSQNPGWVPWLAKEIKGLRDGSKSHEEDSA